jgi:hypothetical protein
VLPVAVVELLLLLLLMLVVVVVVVVQKVQCLHLPCPRLTTAGTVGHQ